MSGDFGRRTFHDVLTYATGAAAEPLCGAFGLQETTHEVVRLCRRRLLPGVLRLRIAAAGGRSNAAQRSRGGAQTRCVRARVSGCYSRSLEQGDDADSRSDDALCPARAR